MSSSGGMSPYLTRDRRYPAYAETRWTNMLYRTLATTLLVLLAADTANAQGGGTAQDKRACSSSVSRFCRSTISGGDMAVLGCLQRNRARIAPACVAVLRKYGQ